MTKNLDLMIMALDDYLRRKRKKSCTTTEAGKELVSRCLLSGFFLSGKISSRKIWSPSDLVRKMIYDGEIPYAYKEGRHWRIPKSPEGYIQELQRKKRVRWHKSWLGVPVAIVVSFVLYLGTYEPEPPTYKTPSSNWDSGLNKNIPATQPVSYDIETKTAVYNQTPPRITQEAYEADMSNYRSKTIIEESDRLIEVNLSKEEIIDQLMDELDLLDRYEEYYDGAVEP